MIEEQKACFNAHHAPTTVDSGSSRTTPVLNLVGQGSTTDACSIECVDALREAFGDQHPRQCDTELASTSQVMLYDPKSGAWPVRDQGKSRGTCVPFAVLAGLELFNIRAGNATGDLDYSEEFLYAKSRTEFLHLGPGDEPESDQTGATFLVQSAMALKQFGIVDEASLP